MKDFIAEIFFYVVLAVIAVLGSMWITQIIWGSTLPEWLKIWLIS